MRKCVFCEMPDSEIARRLYNDKICSVILSRYPVERGHLLVISKKHYPDMFSTPDSVLVHMFKVAKRFGKLDKRKMKSRGMDIGVNIGISSSVHHFHIHILPRYSTRILHFAIAHVKKNEIREKEIRELRHLLNM